MTDSACHATYVRAYSAQTSLEVWTSHGKWALSRALCLCAGDRGMHLACIDADAELRLITIDFKEKPGIEGLATARN